MKKKGCVSKKDFDGALEAVGITAKALSAILNVLVEKKGEKKK